MEARNTALLSLSGCKLANCLTLLNKIISMDKTPHSEHPLVLCRMLISKLSALTFLEEVYFACNFTTEVTHKNRIKEKNSQKPDQINRAINIGNIGQAK